MIACDDQHVWIQSQKVRHHSVDLFNDFSFALRVTVFGAGISLLDAELEEVTA